MKKLFEEFSIGTLTIKNRIVRSATLERLAENQHITPAMVKVYETLAKGGTGLIITSMAAVEEFSAYCPEMIGAWHDAFVQEAMQLTDAAHRHGARIALQIAHCGLKAEPDANGLVRGPSPLPGKPESRALDPNDIRRIITAFKDTALRAKTAGFDAVQLHAAHGFLLSQFLSPYFNKRQDAYGGTLENRARLLMEVNEEVRDAVGALFPVMVKLNSNDLTTPGQTESDFLWLSKQLVQAGIDAIEVSGGLNIDSDTTPIRKNINTPAQEAYFAPAAKALAGEVSVPVISVGGYRSYAVVRDTLESSNIAAIGLCRALVADPDLPNRWESGDHFTSSCISCAQCSRPIGHFYCKIKQLP
ncbi:MAG: NADH:flavin oxidoreductase [Bacillota bacterium]